MTIKKITNYLLLGFLFLLPWQTRYIWQEGMLNQGHWEYGTFSIYATEILLWVIVVLFFVQNFLKKQVWIDLYQKRKTRFSLLFLLGLVLFGISVALSDNFWVSYQFVFRLLEALALLVVMLWQQADFPTQSNRYIFALWAGGIIQGGLAVYQFLNQSVFGSKWLGMAPQQAMEGGASVVEFGIERWLRAYGSFGSPNSLGIYLAVLFILGLILYIKSSSPRVRVYISAGQLFIVSGLVLSLSRAAWLAAFCAVVALGIILFCTEKKSLLLLFKQTSFMAVIAIFWVIIFYPVFSARFNTHLRLEAQSIAERKGQYAEAVSFIKTNPLFGVGPGVFTYALHAKYPNLSYWQYQPIHNIYVLSIVEMGLLGVVGVGMLLVVLLRIILKNNLLFAPVLVCLLVVGLFDHWLVSMFSGMILFWVIVGLGLEKKK